jgi:hypothetical protein
MRKVEAVGRGDQEQMQSNQAKWHGLQGAIISTTMCERVNV